MSETTDPNAYENDEANGQQLDSPSIKQLREAADKSQANAELASSLAKENAFLKAGVNVESPIGKLLFNGYTGELTKEAIVAAATEVGAIKTVEEGAKGPEFVEGEQDQTRQRAELAADNVPMGDNTSEDPQLEGLTKARALLQKGTSRDQASQEFMNTVLDAAVKGDQRVIVSQRRE